jgi:hypothetical protein
VCLCLVDSDSHEEIINLVLTYSSYVRSMASIRLKPSSIVKGGVQPNSRRIGSLSTYSDEVNFLNAPSPGSRPAALRRLGGKRKSRAE